MFCAYQTKYQAQQQHKFLLILIYSSRYVQLQSDDNHDNNVFQYDKTSGLYSHLGECDT